MRTYGETLARELALKVDTIQSGTTTLQAGISPSIVAHLTSSSSIFAFHRDPAGTLGVALCARQGERVLGPTGLFRLASVRADGSTETLDTSTVDWLIVG